jgi:hypothetical protein
MSKDSPYNGKEGAYLRWTGKSSSLVCLFLQGFHLATDGRLGKHPSELPALPARKRQALASTTHEYELRPRTRATEPEPFPLRTEVHTSSVNWRGFRMPHTELAEDWTMNPHLFKGM